MANLDSNIKLQDVIVETSRKVFGRFGFKKTTMEEIANAVHKGRSSIYHYFKNKKDVFRAILEKEGDIYITEVRNAVNAHDIPAEKMRIYIITRMKTLQQLANLYKALKEDYLKRFSRKEGEE